MGGAGFFALAVACTGSLSPSDDADGDADGAGAEGGEGPAAGGRKGSGGAKSGSGGDAASGAASSGGRAGLGGFGGEEPLGNGGMGVTEPGSGGDANGAGGERGSIGGGSSGGEPNGGSASGGEPSGDGGSSAGGSPAQLRNYLPCEVEQIVSTVCRACHNPDGLAQEPPLMTWQEVSFEAEIILDVLSDDYMPYGGPPLSSEQKQTIADWVDAGTPAVSAEAPPACSP